MAAEELLVLEDVALDEVGDVSDEDVNFRGDTMDNGDAEVNALCRKEPEISHTTNMYNSMYNTINI